MGLSRGQFSREFKLAAVRRLEAGVSLAEVARGFEVSPNALDRWRREFRQAPSNAFPGQGQRHWSEGRVAELERKIGQQAAEIVHRGGLKGCLQRIEEQRMLQASTGNPQSAGRRAEEVTAGQRLSIKRMVELGRVSRSGFYRFGEDARPDPDMDLLKANQIDISISRKGNPWDNAACESFMKTLKNEEVLRNEYRDLSEARASIRRADADANSGFKIDPWPSD